MSTVLDYDTAIADGWDYHRNGVSGCGFYVRLTRTALHVRFGDNDTDDGYDPAIVVPLELIVQAIAPEPNTLSVRSAVADEYGIVGFRSESIDQGIAVVNLARLDDCCVAVFDARKILDDNDVRFFYNSWRGDHFVDIVRAAFER